MYLHVVCQILKDNVFMGHLKDKLRENFIEHFQNEDYELQLYNLRNEFREENKQKNWYFGKRYNTRLMKYSFLLLLTHNHYTAWQHSSMDTCL